MYKSNNYTMFKIRVRSNVRFKIILYCAQNAYKINYYDYIIINSGELLTGDQYLIT